VLRIVGDEFIIFINEDVFTRELDFFKRDLISHELGHTYLYDMTKIPFKSYCTLNDRMHFMNYKNNSIRHEEEQLADQIGRFLLAPSNAVNKFIPAFPSMRALLNACEQFQISKRSMIKRLFNDIHDFRKIRSYWYNAVGLFISLEENKQNSRYSIASDDNIREPLRGEIIQSEIQDIIDNITKDLESGKTFNKNSILQYICPPFKIECSIDNECLVMIISRQE